MKVVRRQHPIGQGNFHTASISLKATEQYPTEEKFNYVYDCGSGNSSALNREIGVFVHSNKKVDALFISHLDSDHVSGLDRLIAGIEIDTVYLPYVDDMLTLIELLEEDASVGLTGSLIEAALDPAGFFGRRGVRRVVRVRPGGAPDSAGLILPDLPPEPKFGGGPITAKENPPTRSTMKGKKGYLAELCEMEKHTIIEIYARGSALDWILVPHVTPASKEKKATFKQAIRIVLNLAKGQRLTKEILVEALSNATSRKGLKKCYEEIISGGASRAHNRISMSLYSGPKGLTPNDNREHSFFIEGKFSGDYWPCVVHHGKVGWMGTGDAMLNLTIVRDAWKSAYSPLLSQVATLLLPHHGSRHSFHSELLLMPALSVCLASAADPSQYNHPSVEVIAQCIVTGKRFIHVSQDQRSGVTELVYSHP
jgi:hypothetical protein